MTELTRDEAGPVAQAEIPPLYSPFVPAIHPAHAEINHNTAVWAENLGIGSPRLRRQLAAHDIGAFAARILPEGDAAVVQLLGDFIVWLFLVDDGHCEEGRLGTLPGELAGELSRLLRVAENPDAAMVVDERLGAGLRELRQRMDEYATPSQATRWVEGLRQYFLSVVWEAHHRERDSVPSLDDYTLMRLYTGATTVIFPLLEMAHGYELDADERDATATRAAVEMACFVICWDNDILSLHKESRGDRYWLNAIRVLARERGASPAEALPICVAQRDRVTCRYLRVRNRLATTGGPALRRYLTTADSFIRGAQDWQATSSRYTTPDDIARPSLRFTDTPTDSSDQPLDIPSIAWWWTV
ncbi:selina-4(15),7(11)-diene synthase [Nocardia mexicana]|uniref:Terpene synthase n=1 Tax=Nocardia mexicana TaxID=279262 RepID=A0A370H3L0_9NOCA|nr:selina-4(15),7(11)-diene synthase [Nocardia mexicana]RDI50743.1 hypothetical protein DFR68_105220 [Nocardia mexicana]